jgi:hypothetical protein
MRNRQVCGSVTTFLVGRIGLDFGWSRSSLVVGHCSFVGVGLELERLVVVGVDSCSWLGVLGLRERDGGLGPSVHHLGMLGCSIFRHMNRHRIGSMCHIGRGIAFERAVVDIAVVVGIVAEQVVELVVVVLVGRLVNGLLMLGIYIELI